MFLRFFQIIAVEDVFVGICVGKTCETKNYIIPHYSYPGISHLRKKYENKVFIHFDKKEKKRNEIFFLSFFVVNQENKSFFFLFSDLIFSIKNIETKRYV